MRVLDLPILLVGLAAGVVASLGMVSLQAAPEGHTETAPPAAAPADPALEALAAGCRPAPAELRAGQVLIAGMPGVLAPTDDLLGELIDLQVGGVLFTESNVRNAAQVRRLVTALREGTTHGVLITTDEEPGRVSSFGEVLGRFSSARTLARRGTPADVEVFARQLGVELANLGMDVDFGPVAGADDGPPQGRIGDRSFSGDPDVAADYALAFARGLWTGGVLPAPKFFPGTGRARADAPGELPVLDVSLEVLREQDMRPFRQLVRAGVRAMVTGHTVVTGLDADAPASLSPASYELLRSTGFDGVAVSDAVDAPVLQRHVEPNEAVVRAVAAGADAVLVADGTRARALRDALVAAVRSGALDDARLTEAAGRVLALRGLDPDPILCPSS